MRTIARAGWRIHFNSDLSGEARLVADHPGAFRLLTYLGERATDVHQEVHFPAELLREFQARALDDAADALFDDPAASWRDADWLRQRAARVREGR